jgi:hypothetical protein
MMAGYSDLPCLICRLERSRPAADASRGMSGEAVAVELR